MSDKGGHVIPDSLIEGTIELWRRESPLAAWLAENESEEEKARRAAWRRSWRGRLAIARHRLAQRSAPVRRAIAHAIYGFVEDDD